MTSQFQPGNSNSKEIRSEESELLFALSLSRLQLFDCGQQKSVFAHVEKESDPFIGEQVITEIRRLWLCVKHW